MFFPLCLIFDKIAKNAAALYFPCYQIQCPSCRRHVYALTCCSTCDSRLREQASKLQMAREIHEAYELRVRKLQPLRSSYSKPRQAALSSLLAFLRLLG